MNNYAIFWKCTKFLNWHSLEIVIQNFVFSKQNSSFPVLELPTSLVLCCLTSLRRKALASS